MGQGLVVQCSIGARGLVIYHIPGRGMLQCARANMRHCSTIMLRDNFCH
jgi:hypothetical protein